MAARVRPLRAEPRARRDARRTATRAGLLVAVVVVLLVYGCPRPSEEVDRAVPPDELEAVAQTYDEAEIVSPPAATESAAVPVEVAAVTPGESAADETELAVGAEEMPDDAVHAVLREPSSPPEVAVAPPAEPEPVIPDGARIVGGGGVGGASLRAGPGSFEVLKVWGEGTPLTPLGEEQQLDGLTWIKARDPEGRVGWVLAGSLTSSDPAANGQSSSAPTGVARAGFLPPPPASTGSSSRAGTGGPPPGLPGGTGAAAGTSPTDRSPAAGPPAASAPATTRPAGGMPSSVGAPFSQPTPAGPGQTGAGSAPSSSAPIGSGPSSSAPIGSVPGGIGGTGPAAPAPAGNTDPMPSSVTPTPTPTPVGKPTATPTATPPVLTLPNRPPMGGTGRGPSDIPLPASQRNDPACSSCHVGR